MASTNKSTETSSKTTSKAAAAKDTNAEDEVLKPFQDASEKFLQATVSAHENAMKQYAQTYLDSQEEVQKVQQEGYQAVLEITKKYLDKAGQQKKASSPEEDYFGQAQAQLDYEKEVRQVYADTDAKLQAIARKIAGDETEELTRRLTTQREDAYQAYLSDLQKAWSGANDLNPEAVNAIASNILTTINAVS